MEFKSIPALLLIACLFVSGTTCFAGDAHDLARLGGEMDANEKNVLEEQVVKDPTDIEARAKLLGFYFIKGRSDPDGKSAKQRHVLWLIENAPESEVLGLPYSRLNKILESESYESAKQSWIKVTKDSPDNLAALSNASEFFLMHDRELCEELLLKGQKLDPDNPEWPASLGQLYSLDLIRIPDGASKQSAAKKAFGQYKLAYDRSTPMRKAAMLAQLAKTAFEARLIDDAKQYAEQMLDDGAGGWNEGNQIHHGNLILGRIALTKDDVDEAKSRLLLAGKTTGSPQLNSFGPNMVLAKELLERGEKEVVLEYFALCAKFWKSPRRDLERWIDDVKADRVPQFGGNLAY